MEQFIQEFKVEASGIIQKLQELLLSLEQDKNNKVLIEEIFRGVHTLKGSSRMFGFEKIEHITHHLENTYDLIRSGQLKTSAGVIELSLEVVDVCSDILDDNIDKERYDVLLGQLGSEEIFKEPVSDASGGIFQIFYHPSENVYERGVNPMAALQELEALGVQNIFQLKGDKSFEEQAAEKKFSSAFEIIILLNGEKEQLEDVFLFMDQNEFAIHKLEANAETWDEAIRRTQQHSGKTLDGDSIHQRKEIIKGFFERMVVTEVQQVQKNGSGSAEKAKVKTGDSSATLNFINVKLSRLDDMMRLVSELVSIKAELHYRSTVLNDQALS